MGGAETVVMAGGRAKVETLVRFERVGPWEGENLGENLGDEGPRAGEEWTAAVWRK